MQTLQNVTLGHLPAMSILPGYEVSINDEMIGEVESVSVISDAGQECFELVVGGQAVVLKARESVQLIRPFLIALGASATPQQKQTLAALSFLDTINNAGGIYEREGNVDVAEDDDDSQESWIDLAIAAQHTYKSLVLQGNKHACLKTTVLTEDV